MNTIKYFIEQHPESVAQVFSIYGIKVPPNEKTLAAAAVVHKQTFLADLQNLVNQNSFDDFEGLDGFDVIEGVDGRRWKSKKKHRQELKRNLGGSAKFLQPSRRAGAILLSEESEPVSEINEAQFQELPEIEPSEESDIESAHGKEKKKEFTYSTATAGVDVTKNRRNAKDTIGVIRAGMGAANDAVNMGLDIAGKVKGMKDANGNPIPMDANGNPAPTEPPKDGIKKYLPYIIGGVVLLVVCLGGFFLMKSKK